MECSGGRKKSDGSLITSALQTQGTIYTMKKELSIWSAPLLEDIRKPAYRLEPTASFLIPVLPKWVNLMVLWFILGRQ